MNTNCQAVKTKLDAGEKFFFLDVREQHEFEIASIDGSTLIPMSEIQDRVGEIEPHKADEIIVFCHHGGRSQQVMMWLAQQGYDNVQNMVGGIDEWAQSVDPSLTRY